MVGAANDLNISENGFQTFNNTNGVFHGRTLTAGTGITITNGSGLLGDPVIASTAAATDLHTARFIVASSTAGTGANFTTIAAAIASAQGTGINSTIFIQPGTYTENFTLVAGINLCAFDCDAQVPNVTIIGKITCTDAGTRSISGINLQTNSDFCIAVTGNAATILTLINCNINASNNTAITYTSSSASSTLKLLYCAGNIATTGISLFSSSSAGKISIFYSRFTNLGLSTTASTMSAGMLDIHFNEFDFPITTSGTNLTGSSHNSFVTSNAPATYTWGGSGTTESYSDAYSTSTASAITVSAATKVANADINSSNTNAITGASSISFGNISFSFSSSKINTTTQVSLITTNFTKTINQTFIASGTYTPTTSMKYCIVEVIGGGGAGGSVDGVAGNSAAAGGGGAGGYSRKVLSAATIGTSQTVTIGAGGTPGAAGNHPGGNGGSSSLGALISATGGSGGSGNASSLGSASVGGLGGAGSSGDFNANGSPGGAGNSIFFAGVAAITTSGMGANSYLGGGGLQIATNVGNDYAGNAGLSSGSGGSGAASLSGASGAAGGAGVAGIIIITEYI
jgi:hypothetical protein